MAGHFSLDDKVIVVTGAGQGIGLAIAERLAAAGAVVVGADRQDAGEKMAEIGGSFIEADVSEEASVEALMQEVEKGHGRLDALVNNAGIHRGYDELMEARAEDFEACFRVNTLGVALAIKHGAPRLSDGGAIVNVASVAASLGTAGLATYAASKGGVVSLTRVAAVELAPRRIRVNAICPASIATPMALEEGDADSAALLAVERVAVPLGRIGQPEDVACLAHYLVSEESAFLTGQAINLCGGLSAGLSVALWDRLAD
jgi:NAD(P)-dependent dehydrogenase (short-subunit alcohol dehydrogenase family)